MWRNKGDSAVKNPPTNAGDAGSVPGQGDPLEKEMATHSSVLARETPWSLAGYNPWDPQRVRHNLATKQHNKNQNLCRALCSML